MKNKTHCVYLAYSRKLHLLYIGVKSFYKYKEFFDYKTSSTNKEFRNSIYSKTILSTHLTRKEAEEKEQEYQIRFNVAKDKKFANKYIHRSKEFNTEGIQFTKHRRLKTSIASGGKPFDWVNREGKVEKGLYPFEMVEKYGLAQSNLTHVCSGKYKQSEGWTLLNNPFYEHPFSKARRDKVYKFRHKDGRVTTSTTKQLRDKFGISKSSLSNLTSGRSSSAGGWHIVN